MIGMPMVRLQPSWSAIGRTAINIVVGGAALGVALLLQARNFTQLTAATTSQPELQAQVTATRLTALRQAPTFGFDAMIADWVFLQYLQYFGDDEARSQTGYELAGEYLSRVVELDPRFLNVYIYISPGVSYYAGQPERAVALMDRGMAALSPQLNPRSFIVPNFKALDQLLLIGDIPGAIASYETAAEWVQAPEFAGYDQRMRQTAAFLRENPNSVQAQFIGWNEVLQSAVDPIVRDRAVQGLLLLGAKPQRLANGQIIFTAPDTLTPMTKK